MLWLVDVMKQIQAPAPNSMMSGQAPQKAAACMPAKLSAPDSKSARVPVIRASAAVIRTYIVAHVYVSAASENPITMAATYAGMPARACSAMSDPAMMAVMVATVDSAMDQRAEKTDESLR